MAGLNPKFVIASAPIPVGLLLLPLVRTAVAEPGHQASAMAGWLLALLLVESIPAIIAGCQCRNSRQWCLVALIAGAATAIAPVLACVLGLLSALVLLRVIAVLLAWAAFCAGLAAFFSRWGPVGGVMVAMCISNAMMFSPLVFTPVFLLLSHGHAPSQWIAGILLNMSPALWMINAMATGLHYNWFIWFHAPMMYHHVVLGQNTLMPEVWRWWIPCLIAATLGAAAASVAGKCGGDV
jgi:hypothetical protein